MGDLVETRQNELKKKKICRFCLSQDGADLSNIYSRENRMKTAPLPLQVMACVSIEVFSNDCMPSFVCNECRIMFDYCYRFKQMCKKADTCLRHYPLTGIWSSAMEKPKIPPELLKNVKIQPPTSLNALQIQRDLREKDMIVEKIELDEESCDTFLTMVTESQQQVVQSQVEEPQPDPELEPEPESEPESPNLKPIQKLPTRATAEKPSQKLLNKSAIRILNKEAQCTIEPRMSKPRLKRDTDGNIAVVTEILDPNIVAELPDPVESATVVKTHVFPCPHCERSFPLRQLLDIHMVNHNRERSFNCKDCEKSFFSKYDLQKHVMVHTGEKPFKCVICGKGFTRSTLLNRHEKTHTDIPKFICVFCEKAFISQEEMEKHTERHRKNRPFTCKICNKSFAFKQGLERHEVVHCRFQPYQCQYCDLSFSTPSKLARHLTAHAGARPYPCKLCPKAYLLSHHLTRHMRSHKNGSGSYKCNDCDKTFSTRDDLIYHSAVHATQTLVCPLCKDSFDDIETVTEHVKQHAEGEAYACEFCDLIFMTAERLQEHTDSDHIEEMEQYNEDEQVAAQKKNEIKDIKPNDIKPNDIKQNDSGSRDIDEVIEEFLIEEFSDAGAEGSGENEKTSNIIVKEENEWQTENSDQTSQEVYASSIGSESIDYMNIIEMSESMGEPIAKATKVSEVIRKVTKKSAATPTLLRHKTPTRTAPSVTSLPSNSSLPKENKKPLPKSTSIKIEVDSIVAASTPVPKSRQPTIQAALQALPKSLSVKRLATTAKSQQTESQSKLFTMPSPVKKPPAAAAPVTKPAAKEPTAQESVLETKQSALRMLRQRSDISPNTKPAAKVNLTPSPSTEEIKKPPPKASLTPMKRLSPGTLTGEKKIVEMMIGDKRVKVQKITMSKAQAAAMARDGRIQMKEGTMILKKDPKQSPKPVRQLN